MKSRPHGTSRYPTGTTVGMRRALRCAMHRWLPVLAVVVVACARATPVRTVEIEPSSSPRVERVSGGGFAPATQGAVVVGTSLVIDDLQAAMTEIRMRGPTVSALVRAALVAEHLNVEPTVEGEQWVFYAIGPRTALAPYSCHALRIDAFGPTLELDDHHGCALPYADSTTRAPAGGARFTVNRLRDVLARDAISSLGAPDRVEGGRTTWYGVGPRGDGAPITCYALRVKGSMKSIDRASLDACGIVWPVAAQRFVVPPPERDYRTSDLDTLCARCGPREVCVLDEAVPVGARIRERADRTFARYDDGRPAKLVVTASCWALPTTCADAFACGRVIPCPAGGTPTKLERGAAGSPSRATCR